MGEQDATFTIEPDVVVGGGRRVAPNGGDAVSVRAGSARTWRWTNDSAPVPPGTAVTRCSATVLAPGGGEGDD